MGIWKRKVAEESQIEISFIPGDHMTCRTDYIQELTEQFSKCIHEVQTDDKLDQMVQEIVLS